VLVSARLASWAATKAASGMKLANGRKYFTHSSDIRLTVRLACRFEGGRDRVRRGALRGTSVARNAASRTAASPNSISRAKLDITVMGESPGDRAAVQAELARVARTSGAKHLRVAGPGAWRRLAGRENLRAARASAFACDKLVAKLSW